MGVCGDAKQALTMQIIVKSALFSMGKVSAGLDGFFVYPGTFYTETSYFTQIVELSPRNPCTVRIHASECGITAVHGMYN